MAFEWSLEKELKNIQKHGVNFSWASLAFEDHGRKIIFDDLHSQRENRYYCIGKVKGRLMTVRFVMRGNDIRIFGAGYGDWTL